MFYKYEIVNNILYLYLDMKYEFANEFSLENDISVINEANKFIQKNNIKFSGKKIYLVVDGIVVKRINVNNKLHVNPDFSADNYIIVLRLEDNSLCEITLREYLISILFSNYVENINIEVLKSMTILYITYVYKMMKENGFISSNNEFVLYRALSYYKEYSNSFDNLYSLFNEVIDEVDCMFMKYDDLYILPFIHYSNIGKTLENNIYPYLSSVKSLWDLTSPYFITFKDYSYKDINDRLNTKISFKDNFDIKLDDNIKQIIIGNKTFTTEEFKNIFNLISDDIYLIVNKNYLRIITMGYGNSYGLSIYGANSIALDGGNYYDILKYYFPKVNIYRYIKELS